MTNDPAALVAEFGQRLADLGWVSALHVGGSLATGDHRPNISDLDLVAVADGPVTTSRRAELRTIHDSVPAAAKLGCVYVPGELVAVPTLEHVTWTHGQMIDRWLSGVARAELLEHGYAIFGPGPTDVWPPMTPHDVRAAVADELTGYWSWAVRRPWLWFSSDDVDLAVTSMLRARHTLATGQLINKSDALGGEEAARLPAHLRHDVQARRDGAVVRAGARLPLQAMASWRLTRRTIAGATSRG